MRRIQYFPVLSLLAVLLPVALLLPACASKQPRFHAKKASAVEKVALLAFEVRQEQPRSLHGSPVLNQSRLSPASQDPALKKMASELYSYFVKELARISSWKAIDAQSVSLEPSYASAFKARMQSLRAHETEPSDSGRVTLLVYPERILDLDAWQILNHTERAKLARELGVDAFAELMILQTPSAERARKEGKIIKENVFSLTSQAWLKVYGLDSDDPIWEAHRVEGDRSPNSATLSPELSPREQHAELGRQSGVLAIQRLLSTYGTK